MSLAIVGRLLGHTNPSTTQRYAHLADDPLREASEIMGRKFTDLDADIRAFSSDVYFEPRADAWSLQTVLHIRRARVMYVFRLTSDLTQHNAV
jgi:hypothetical protein